MLSRRQGERIIIGDDIVITLLEIDRNKIRIGVECPREVGVYREEILPHTHPQYNKIRRNIGPTE